uniref:Uncharacterized protein n=1 Tax=Thermosporothrix sp. COM3 TaxID=2490863 RepID=A0A455SHQ0_9CHLR|nr:hypothetical protein KTC_27540 [Thermosporothrix sp. COM3]
MTQTSGIFLRQYMGQTETSARAGWASSPDIIPNGTSPGDPQQFAREYDTDFEQQLPMTRTNYIYFRGKNLTDGQASANVYLYYVESSLILWPNQWKGKGDPSIVRQDGTQANDTLLKAEKKGEIVVSEPLLWTPPHLEWGKHYCMIVWIGQDGKKPPDFAGMPSMDDTQFQAFLVDNPFVTRNTVTLTEAPPDYKYTTQLQGTTDDLLLHITVGFPQFPSGNYSISIPGVKWQGKDNLYFQGAIPPDGQNHTYEIELPQNYNTSIVIEYDKSSGTIPVGAAVKIDAIQPVSSFSQARFYERFPHLTLPLVYYAAGHTAFSTCIPIKKGFVLGQQRWVHKIEQ